MSFAQRLKTDKKFRRNVILGFIVVVLVLGNFQEDKKGFQDPAICDGVNPWSIGASPSDCEALGCIPVTDSLTALLYIDCVSCGAPGQYVGTDSATNGCCTGRGEEQSGWDSIGSLFSDIYLCKVSSGGGTGGECGTDFQRSLASLIPMDDWDCKMKFYIVAFGGIFIALMLFMAAM